jgi:hypothetical protein
VTNSRFLAVSASINIVPTSLEARIAHEIGEGPLAIGGSELNLEALT